MSASDSMNSTLLCKVPYRRQPAKPKAARMNHPMLYTKTRYAQLKCHCRIAFAGHFGARMQSTSRTPKHRAGEVNGVGERWWM